MSEGKEQNETNQPTDNLDDLNIPNLRTYKEDIQRVVKNQDISSTRILLEEQRKKANAKASKESASLSNKSNKIFFISSLVLVLVAGGILGLIWFLPDRGEENQSRILIERPAFFEVDGQTAISVELRTQRNIFSDLGRMLVSAIPQDTIEEVLLARAESQVVDGDQITIPKPIESTELFQLLESRAPEYLVRSISNEFMIGLYGTNTVEPFILFKVNDFENVYAGMLEWEDTLARDMQPIFFPSIKPEDLSHPRIIQQPQETEDPEATNTPAVIPEPQLSFDPTIFRDKVILNNDSRALINDLGEIVFFYTFVNSDHLVLASSSETLEEIIRRLRQARLIR